MRKKQLIALFGLFLFSGTLLGQDPVFKASAPAQIQSGQQIGRVVVFRREIQEPLEPGTRMLGTLALVSVRQQHHEAAGLSPFLLGAGDELVNHDLGAVGDLLCGNLQRALVVALDDEALEAFQKLTQIEGIIPALESAHAIAQAAKVAPGMALDANIIVNRGGATSRDVLALAERMKQAVRERFGEELEEEVRHLVTPRANQDPAVD